MANSLMRLKCEGEQPLDRYIRFKNNPLAWTEEMTNYGLTLEEQQVLKDHLINNCGVCDTQEELMRLVMDKKIGGFTLTEANNFRKAIAKKSEKKQKEQKKLLFEKGVSLGNRKEFLEYVWDYEIRFSLGYAFSSPHVIGYTFIAMQEMNLCLRYGSIWWKTGCLKVDSGMIGEDIKTTKYGDIARAVSTMISDVRPPDINKSQWGFEIVPEENKIYYGFLPITGIGKKEIETIIENRPYKSFKDFFLRVAQPNLLSPKKVLTLIKAGCFDSFNANRRQVAEVFIRAIVPRAEKVTLTSINTFKNELRRKDMYVDIVDLWEFKKMAVGKKAKMNKNLEQVFISKYSNYVDYDYVNGKLVIDEKSFDKYYKQQVKPLQEYLKTNEAKDMITNIKRREMWLENCGGNVSAWEMETLDLYFTKHELEIAPINKYFKLSNFSELPENPKPISYNKWRGNQFPVYDTCQIAGTVIDKNKVKNIVYLLTTDGVVTLKIPSGQFNYYDRMVVEVKNGKKRVIEKSWFEKGSILVVNGYRKETNFFVKKAKNQEHGIMKINRYNQNQIEFLSERKKV